MKKHIHFLRPLFIFALIWTSSNQAQKPKPVEKYDLMIIIDNYNPKQGKLYVAVYNNEKDFYQKKMMKINLVKKDQGVFVVSGLPEGNYAVMVMQDTNGNGRLDFNHYIPTEPYGISNNPQLAGPPSWQDAVFKVPGKKNIHIILHN